jgi:hypothetical protein
LVNVTINGPGDPRHPVGDLADADKLTLARDRAIVQNSDVLLRVANIEFNLCHRFPLFAYYCRVAAYSMKQNTKTLIASHSP